MRKDYAAPKVGVVKIEEEEIISTSNWNDVGNYGPGDEEDDDRIDDDNWDKDWSWGNN